MFTQTAFIVNAIQIGGMNVNIMLLGAMGVGKTATAKVLEDQYGYRLYSLAEPVRNAVNVMFPWLAHEPKSVRRTYLQQVGQFLRNFRPNPILLHAELVLKNTPLVIDDGRTVEEAVWAVSRGIAVIVLTCSDNERCFRLIARDGALPDPRTFKDVTEQDWKNVNAPRIDTTNLTPEEVAKAVVDLIHSGAVFDHN